VRQKKLSELILLILSFSAYFAYYVLILGFLTKIQNDNFRKIFEKNAVFLEK
jgi:hypothetical protein